MFSDITAVIPTRGDQDLSFLLNSLPFDDIIVWDNKKRPDLGTYGRYEAIFEAKNEKIYTQDDDAIVPIEVIGQLIEGYEDGKIIASMPWDHAQDLEFDQCLLGWGSMFRADLPEKAFETYSKYYKREATWWNIDCDRVFPGLTPFKRISGEHINLPWATGPGRTYRQLGYEHHRQSIIDKIIRIRELENGV